MATWLEEYVSNLEVRDGYEKANEAPLRAYTTLANQHSDLHKAISNSVPPPHTFPDDHSISATPQPRRSASPSSSSYPQDPKQRPSSRTKLPLPPSIVGSAPPSVPPQPARDETHPGSGRDGPVIAGLRTDLASANRHIASLASQVKSLEATVIPQHESTIASQQSQIARLLSQLCELKDDYQSRISTLQRGKETQISKLERDTASLSRKLRDRDSEAREKDQLLRRTQDEMVSLEMQVNVSDEKIAALERENGRIIEKLGQKVDKDVDQ